MAEYQLKIRNDFIKTLSLNIEPEGAFFPLLMGEEVTVTDEFKEAPVTLSLTASSSGEPILTIWPGDGDVRVEQNGIDVLALVPSSVRA